MEVFREAKFFWVWGVGCGYDWFAWDLLGRMGDMIAWPGL